MDPAASVYFDNPGVASVRWDEDAQLVLVEWQGWANSSEFADLLEAEIHALREHKGSRLLADCRRQKVLNPADQDRANEQWLPRALAAGLKRFAVVVPSSVLAEVNLRASLATVPAAALEVAYFATPAEARDWLGR
ncbi:MAG TPA: STAS/SEC14 domain-containing protein [Candidatus Dormibacteraeota bacterium]|jgi:SpoIIAA-like|nr:STAS/SEC14 domain-containing protein [Candidatus Dormibacteraeota bacterium]